MYISKRRILQTERPTSANERKCFDDREDNAAEKDSQKEKNSR